MALFHTTVLDNQIKALDTIGTASGSIATFDTDKAERLYECNVENTATKIGIDKKYGGFVDFNQLLQNGNFTSITGWSISNATSITALDNVLSYIQTITGLFANPVSANVDTFTDHIYLFTLAIKSVSSASNIRIRQPVISSGKAMPLNEWYDYSEIFKCTADNNSIAIQFDSVTNNEINLRNFMIIDLTQMFGISKAEEILTMEQQISGSGVAYVKNLLYKDYYDYDVGTVGTIGEINNDNTGKTYAVSDKYDVITYNGNNNVFTDSGNISVKYLVSVGKAIS